MAENVRMWLRRPLRARVQGNRAGHGVKGNTSVHRKLRESRAPALPSSPGIRPDPRLCKPIALRSGGGTPPPELAKKVHPGTNYFFSQAMPSPSASLKELAL